MASSSSSPLLSNMKYDVFLSFRGEDTRNNFTSHLYHALQRKKIKTFMDHELNRGEEISQNLIDAIKESKISVIVFSENYANSKWCLNELLMILECRDAPLNQIVMPVFYNVDPKDVRNQTGKFGSSFGTAVKKSQEKEARWRGALKDAGTLSGWHTSKDRSEAILVDTIVDEVSKQLRKISSNTFSLPRELVGMNSSIEKIMSLLKIESPEFLMVGISGMGGVGKTTLAEVIFHKISWQFESFSFLINVREKAKKTDLFSLRDDLISKLLKEDKLEIGTPHINSYIKNRLRCTRVLVVFDDVDNSSQLQVLIGERERILFGPGSRVIVTCRDKQVLTSYHMARLYDMERLHDDEALQLFSNYAFHQNQPPEPYLEFTKTVVTNAKGIALLLKVLGSSLRGKTDVQHWESALGNLKEDPDMKILDVLKISYDGLNTYEKDIFLDIACFFKGNDIDFVTRILDRCYPSASCCIHALIHNSLITICQNKKIEMHDLLQEMGWNIVSEESEEPGSRSRMWRPEDVCDVLTRNAGTEKIKGIFFDVSQVNRMNLDSQIFAKMSNLKFLKIYDSSRVRSEWSRAVLSDEQLDEVLDPRIEWSKVHFPDGLESLPDELRYLSWFACPLKCFPSAFSPDNLVELDIFGGNLGHLWNRPQACYLSQTLVHLKALRLENCACLGAIPDLSGCKDLEELVLKGCWLGKIPSSIKYLNELKRLDLDYSNRLKSLPSMDYLRKLTHLNLFYCKHLEEIPESSIENLNYLTNLALTSCERLTLIPSSIGNLKSLTNLSLINCRRLVEFPPSIGNLNNLTNLSLINCRRLVEFPPSIGNLNNLTNLDVLFCKSLVEIPSTIGYLKSLIYLDLNGCEALERLPNNINLASLTHLSTRDCSKITEFPDISRNIKVLEVDITSMINIPSSIALLVGLHNLTLWNCTDYQMSPSFLEKLKHLTPITCQIEVYPKEVEDSKNELFRPLRRKWSSFKGRLRTKSIYLMLDVISTIDRMEDVLD